MDTTPRTDGNAPAAGPERLHRGALGLADITASTMANIGPAMSFFFGFALIAQTAGVAAPLTILAATVVVALLGNTLAEFSRSIPSTGSFITFIGKTFGPVAAITTTIVVSLGYIIAVSSVVAISGGWTSVIIAHYFHVHIAWQWFTAVLTAGAFVLMVKGVSVSTKWAGALFAFEMGLLLLVSVWVLIKHGGHLTAAPFEPGHLAGGIKGLGLGFPLAVYLFVGWENSAALAEETNNPRAAVPKAIYLSVAAMAVSYLLFSYVTVVGFGYDTAKLGASKVPFVDVAQGVLGGGAVLAYLAGFTSIVGSLISAANSQSRLIFNSGREGLLPSAVARVTPNTRTPWASFVVYLVIALALAFGWGWNIDPVTFFGDSATLGTILIVVTWLVANLALPVYYRRNHRDLFSPLRHLVLPLCGVVAIGYPLYQLVKPGQPAPFNSFPLISAAVIVVAVVYALILNARDRTLGERVGSIVADLD
ncbi:APC family permease [Streptomyces sp. RB6PN25]|uniref:APC family permease n=1 Tax=Streptomyces humicola TaxID=2953240 RepID=A0ABT1PY01_9ACTN|nr:APC family permease [Streptomyces humicola]MCQ4081410.1 APC family permease [Streptomyces humicola]